MNLAFSTIACPAWDFATIATSAKEFGFDGVELRGYLDEPARTASNVFLTDPQRVRGIFEEAGTPIACLTSSISMGKSRRDNEAAARALRTYIETAATLNCPIVRLADHPLRRGQAHLGAAVAMGKWLAPLAEFAAAHPVSLAVGNQFSFRNSREMWTLLETVNHPAVGAAWDVLSAAGMGESPAVSVPTLSGRIAFAIVSDARLYTPPSRPDCGPIEPVMLGEGDVPVKNFLTRLMGVGYKGWVSFEWDKVTWPLLTEPSLVLPRALEKLREWSKPQVGKPVKKEHPPAKAKA